MSGRSTFNGVNLPISPSAGTINHGLFVWSGGSVLLGQGHQYLWPVTIGVVCVLIAIASGGLLSVHGQLCALIVVVGMVVWWWVLIAIDGMVVVWSTHHY